MTFNFGARNPLGKNPGIPAATAAIKGWARTILGLDESAVVSINELSCAKPDCPPRETVILVLRPGAPALRLSVHKAIVDVTEADVTGARLKGVETLQAKGSVAATL